MYYYTFTHTVTLAIIMCTALAVTIILAVTITVVIILKRFIYRKDDTALHTRVLTDNTQIEGGNTLRDTSTLNLLSSPHPLKSIGNNYYILFITYTTI